MMPDAFEALAGTIWPWHDMPDAAPDEASSFAPSRSSSSSVTGVISVFSGAAPDVGRSIGGMGTLAMMSFNEAGVTDDVIGYELPELSVY